MRGRGHAPREVGRGAEGLRVAASPAQNGHEQEIIDFCRDQLAHFKCPKAVEFGELPKTSTGKIQKFRLREKEWAGAKKLVN